MKISKEDLDAGLVLHGLKTDAPSQLSDSFRAGVKWAIATQALEATDTLDLINKARIAVASSFESGDKVFIPRGLALQLRQALFEYDKSPIQRGTD